jgi:hypothetical protein
VNSAKSETPKLGGGYFEKGMNCSANLGYLVLSTKFQNSIAVEEAAICLLLLLLLLLSCGFFLAATAAAVFLRIFFSQSWVFPVWSQWSFETQKIHLPKNLFQELC